VAHAILRKGLFFGPTLDQGWHVHIPLGGMGYGHSFPPEFWSEMPRLKFSHQTESDDVIKEQIHRARTLGPFAAAWLMSARNKIKSAESRTYLAAAEKSLAKAQEIAEASKELESKCLDAILKSISESKSKSKSK
jgi:hypothetical protein